MCGGGPVQSYSGHLGKGVLYDASPPTAPLIPGLIFGFSVTASRGGQSDQTHFCSEGYSNLLRHRRVSNGNLQPAFTHLHSGNAALPVAVIFEGPFPLESLMRPLFNSTCGHLSRLMLGVI